MKQCKHYGEKRYAIVNVEGEPYVIKCWIRDRIRVSKVPLKGFITYYLCVETNGDEKSPLLEHRFPKELLFKNKTRAYLVASNFTANLIDKMVKLYGYMEYPHLTNAEFNNIIVKDSSEGNWTINRDIPEDAVQDECSSEVADHQSNKVVLDKVPDTLVKENDEISLSEDNGIDPGIHYKENEWLVLDFDKISDRRRFGIYHNVTIAIAPLMVKPKVGISTRKQTIGIGHKVEFVEAISDSNVVLCYDLYNIDEETGQPAFIGYCNMSDVLKSVFEEKLKYSAISVPKEVYKAYIKGNTGLRHTIYSEWSSVSTYNK